MNLIEKYNASVPRYTSYPSVPHWNDKPDTTWARFVEENLKRFGHLPVSIYVHLPYCESLCTFCGCNTRITVNHNVESPYIEGVLNEWKHISRLAGAPLNIECVHFGGGTPTFFSPTNLLKLANGLLEGHTVSPNASLSFEANPGSTTKKHLELLASVGFSRVSFGVQDFDTEVQKTVNRIETVDKVRQVTDWAREHGYTSINYDLIYGLPKQTVFTVENTIDQVNLLHPDRIAFYSYAHVPWIKRGQNSYRQVLPTPDEKIKMLSRARELFRQAGYEYIGLDHFALPTDTLYRSLLNGTLQRNFMGYTEVNTPLLIGLGVSAISSSPMGYTQNVKTIEAYLSRVQSGVTGAYRGHRFGLVDVIFKDIIENIMCGRAADLTEAVPFLPADAVDRLCEMENDNLLRFRDNTVEPTTLGRYFLRNICAAIDPAMAGQREENRFSMSV
ncbi:MAG: oxygen-independent coproporphyrinogen III oxidase [Salibacteraceae bacterium]